jgi:hypothetical protein
MDSLKFGLKSLEVNEVLDHYFLKASLALILQVSTLDGYTVFSSLSDTFHDITFLFPICAFQN